MTQLRTSLLIAYINNLLIKHIYFYTKWYVSDLHWESAYGNRNTQPNLISFESLNPLDLKCTELHPETTPLLSLILKFMKIFEQQKFIL